MPLYPLIGIRVKNLYHIVKEVSRVKTPEQYHQTVRIIRSIIEKQLKAPTRFLDKET